MAGSTSVARALVDYDPRLAERLLRLVASELGVAADGDVSELQAALQTVLENGTTETTVEWKAAFAHVERMRSLGLELAKLLDGAEVD
jgi:hypothetical protein